MRNLNVNNIKCLFGLILVLLGLNTVAQTKVIENPNIPKIENSISEYVSVDTILSFTNEVAVNRSLKSCKWENEIVFTNFNTNKNSDTIVIYKINIVDANVDTFYVYEKRIRERMKSVYSSSFDAIAYNGSKIVLNLYDELYVYELDSNHKLNKIGKYTVAEDFREMAFLNDSVLVFVQNYYSASPQTAIYLYDMLEHKVINKIFPHFNTTLLSFFSPQKNFDIYENRILWANRGEYSFLLFDRDLKKLDSVSIVNKNWKQLSKKAKRKASKIKKTHTPDIIYCLNKEYNNIDQLQFAYILDTNHIAIGVHRAKENVLYIDVWYRIGGEWKIKHNALYDDGFMFKPERVIRRNTLPLGFLVGSKVYFMDNKLVSISDNAAVENPINLSVKDYFIEQNKYLETNEYFVQIFIYSHTLTD